MARFHIGRSWFLNYLFLINGETKSLSFKMKHSKPSVTFNFRNIDKDFLQVFQIAAF